MKPLRLLRRLPTTVRNAMCDLRYGAFLGGTVKTRFEHLGAHDVSNTEYADMAPLFAAAAVSPSDVIVDVGAGKGRALNWLVENYPRNRIIGIELDPLIAQKTARRLRRFDSVTVMTGDATTLLPREGTVFFLFNPFDDRVMQRFVDAFLTEGMHPNRRIVYHNSKYISFFRDDARFTVTDIELPSGNFHSALVALRG